MEKLVLRPSAEFVFLYRDSSFILLKQLAKNFFSLCHRKDVRDAHIVATGLSRNAAPFAECIGGNLGKDVRKALRAEERAGVVGDEIEHHLPLSQHNALHTTTAAETSEGSHTKEFFSLRDERTETVLQTLAESLDLGIVGQTVELAVEEHPFAGTRHIGFGEIGTEVAFDVALRHECRAIHFIGRCRAPCGTDFRLCLIGGGNEFWHFIMEFRHGFGQNLLIGFVAEVGNESALFGSQQVTGTTDIKVLHGNVYAGTEIGKVLDGL